MEEIFPVLGRYWDWSYLIYKIHLPKKVRSSATHLEFYLKLILNCSGTVRLTGLHWIQHKVGAGLGTTWSKGIWWHGVRENEIPLTPCYAPATLRGSWIRFHNFTGSNPSNPCNARWNEDGVRIQIVLLWPVLPTSNMLFQPLLQSPVLACLDQHKCPQSASKFIAATWNCHKSAVKALSCNLKSWKMVHFHALVSRGCTWCCSARKVRLHCPCWPRV